MQSIRNALSSENLHLLATIAESGSLAAAARRLGVVPSALSYRLRRMEELLDVLLIDRSTRRAQLTPAGQELLRASVHLLAELEAVALRVRRVAHGWESQLVLVADNVVATEPLFDLLEQFYALNAPTRIKLRVEVLKEVKQRLGCHQVIGDQHQLGFPTVRHPHQIARRGAEWRHGVACKRPL